MAHRPRRASLPVFLLLLPLYGCGIEWQLGDASASEGVATADAHRDGLAAQTRSKAAATGRVADADSDMREQSGPASAAAERLLIHTGELRIAVAAPEEAARVALAFVKELGGHAQAQTNDTLVLRVPAPRFFAAVERAARLGRLLDKRIAAQDVTEEVVDLRLRLQNARALRQRLEELLGRASNVKEVLEIEAELTRVRTEVERIEGRLQALESQVALSTLTLHFVRAAVAARSSRLPFSWLDALGVENLIAREGGR